jgi:uncharacterized protein
MADWLSGDERGAILQVFVQPRASRNQLVGLQGEELKVRLTSPPVEGAANKSCCEFFAKLFGVAKGAVELLAGETSRHKRLLVRNLPAEEARHILSDKLGQ